MDHHILVTHFELAYGKLEGISESGGLSLPVVAVVVYDYEGESAAFALSTVQALAMSKSMADCAEIAESRSRRRLPFAFTAMLAVLLVFVGLQGYEAARYGIDRQNGTVLLGIFQSVLLLFELVGVFVISYLAGRRIFSARRHRQRPAPPPLDGSHEAL